MHDILNHFTEAEKVLKSFYSNPNNLESIKKAGDLMVNSLEASGKIISCGNGGSMSDAMHFAEELSGRYRKNRPALAGLSISDPSHISCVANDFGYEFIFSRYIESVGKENDVLLAISTSGNSQNVIKAAKVAHKLGMKVVALTGKEGGELASFCDVEIRIAHKGYADRIQEVHIKIIHALIHYIESKMF